MPERRACCARAALATTLATTRLRPGWAACCRPAWCARCWASHAGAFRAPHAFGGLGLAASRGARTPAGSHADSRPRLSPLSVRRDRADHLRGHHGPRGGSPEKDRRQGAKTHTHRPWWWLAVWWPAHEGCCATTRAVMEGGGVAWRCASSRRGLGALVSRPSLARRVAAARPRARARTHAKMAGAGAGSPAARRASTPHLPLLLPACHAMLRRGLQAAARVLQPAPQP
jgi:hypothetical protein